MPPEYATERQTSMDSTALAEVAFPGTVTCARTSPVLMSGTGPVADAV